MDLRNYDAEDQNKLVGQLVLKSTNTFGILAGSVSEGDDFTVMFTEGENITYPITQVPIFLPQDLRIGRLHAALFNLCEIVDRQNEILEKIIRGDSGSPFVYNHLEMKKLLDSSKAAIRGIASR